MKTWLINSASAHQPSCITRSTPTTSHSPPPMQKMNLVTLLNCTSHQKLFLLDYGFLGRNLSAVILAVRIKCGQIWENSIVTRNTGTTEQNALKWTKYIFGSQEQYAQSLEDVQAG